MLFDTGASMTTIDVSIANRSGISLRDAKPIAVHGVGGTVNGHLATINEFWVGDLNIGAVAAYVLPFDKNSEVQAVLGMNVIKEFKVTIDLLQRDADSEGTIFMEPTFDTNTIHNADTFISSQSRFGIWSATQSE